MHFNRSRLLVVLWLGLIAVGRPTSGGFAVEPPATADDARFSTSDLEFFEGQVRPLLVARCYECHRSELDEPKGGLRLDSRSAILSGGDTGPSAVPGDADESLLIDAIRYGDIYQMPPKSKLPDDEIAVLERWVKLGLPWPKETASRATEHVVKKFDLPARRAAHWACQPVQAVKVPVVASAPVGASAAWPAYAATGASATSADIDQFIHARLAESQLSPAPRAERSALLRRVYFDLIGLPPSSTEVRAFLADDSSDALAKVVDQLLSSPHFGERWGRHWLDLVRYAESRGHEFDYTIPNVWQYRDYVIRAVNADVPYDQFVREHIAGDLFPQPRLNEQTGANESILATGFWFLGEWVHSPVDIRKDETDRLDNMIDVATKTFLGMTVSCARCHDHKFDAISQADYYALAGYLKSSSYRLACFETMEHNRSVALQLAELDARYATRLAPALIDSYQAVLERLDEYLLAAREILLAMPDMPDKENAVVADVLGTPVELRNEAAVRLAKEQGLDATVLQAWIEMLVIARREPEHPLYPFALLTTDKSTTAESLRSLLEPARRRLSQPQTPSPVLTSGVRVIVDYDAIDPTEFLPDGVGFGLRPIQAGELLLSDRVNNPLAGVQRFSAARRAAVWSRVKPAAGADNDPGRMAGWVRAAQSIRTPSFTLNAGRLFYLVEGKGNIYANVSSHVTNNGPLHGQLIGRFETKPGLGPVWVEQNLTAYAGHTLHVEFAAEGDQDCFILKVVEADQAPAAYVPDVTLLAEISRREYASPAEFAQAYQKLFQALGVELSQNRLMHASEREAQADLADWMVSQPNLFMQPGSKAYATYQRQGTEYQAARKTLLDAVKPESQLAMAMQEGTGQDELLLVRGNSRTPGEPIPRRFLSALGGDEMPPPTSGSGRQQLADQIVSLQNPLTSRVMVNRIWHHLLGRGIVASVDNFGVLGDKPTHPELLDYLALRFVEQGWSVKQMIRSIVLSQTYQMASRHNPAADERDPSNLLYHRANIRRLEGEAIRDALLAVSGRLDRQQFGPSVPVHLTDFLQGRGRPASGPVDGAGRRSIYISIRRNFLSPMMLAFDMPIPFNTVGRRNVSNVPAQALILMNDPLVVEQARLWARHTLADLDKSIPGRIDEMYLEAFARHASGAEVQLAIEFLQQQAVALKLSPDQIASHEQLWADFAHVLFNAKEFIFLQ